MLMTDKQHRKERPMYRGLLRYFPDALAEVANVSLVGNQQHNPGQELHWDRRKSLDHGDCIVRHQVDAGLIDDDGMRHSAKVAWRALAQLQIELETARDIDECVVRCDHETSGPRTMRAAYKVLPQPDPQPRPRVYIAGPMRGIPEFNFPAFDRARDMMAAQGWDVISPADLDRDGEVIAQNDEEAGSEDMIHTYMDRDLTDTLLTFRASQGDAIAMLPGWENSTGAVAEFMVARWAKLRILDATTGNRLMTLSCNTLGRTVADHLLFANK